MSLRKRYGLRRQREFVAHILYFNITCRSSINKRRICTLEVWKKYAANLVDTDAMPCGHYIAEEMPDHVYERFVGFFKA
jgi:hypothetical protein